MTLTERLRRAAGRLAAPGAWSPDACDAWRSFPMPSWWIREIFGPCREWCEPGDKTADAFSLRGALLADGLIPDEAPRLLCLVCPLPIAQVAGFARDVQPVHQWAALQAWESAPGRTSNDVQRLFIAAAARAAALTRVR